MQVETFKMYCDLVETQSFTRAAEINGITQSAVSQNLVAMEQYFQVPLIVRGRGVHNQIIFRLTPKGKVVYKYSRTIADAHATMQNRVRRPKSTRS